ncbi:hypothetical protein [Pontibacter sp. BAB1700]|uniref:hypothetical protein n=1 Tax=Pontibacter sp. BAB1700 TaxID=1144253 RepID=UPI00026BE3BD|nr:hypothetical protein [Pontibacter sp. BAB1700]EJF10342.1 alpha/beta hydrolase [Pontibacter sp. BAB1700]
MKMLRFVCLFMLLALTQITQAVNKSFYFTTSDGVQLYVRMAGEGKPCLFIHGGPAPGLNTFMRWVAMW